MSIRIFDNPHNLPGAIIQSRIRTLDRQAICVVYDVTPLQTGITTRYVSVESTVTEADIIVQLSVAITDAEKNEYQNTIDQLTNIENATNPTNAQVIAAVKYLAKTLRILIKMFVRYY